VKKSIIVGVLFVALLVTVMFMAGCSQDDAGDSGSDERVFKVGVLGPFTGPAARSGVEFKNAADMAFEEVDYMIGDYKVELVWIDSQSDPDKATRAYEDAVIRDGIEAGIVNWHSSVAVAIMEVVAAHQIPHFHGFGATEVVNEKWASDPEKYSYWMTKGWPTPAKTSVAYVYCVEEAIEQGTWAPDNKRMAIVGEETDWGRSFGNSLAEQFEAAGWEIVAYEYFPIGETEFYPLLTKLRDLDVSIIGGTISSLPSVSSFVKQFNELEIRALLIADALGETGEWYDLTGEASNFILDNRPLFASPEAKEFAAKFEEKYGIAPGAAAGGQVYDGARLFISLAEAALAEHGELSSEILHTYAMDHLLTGEFTYKDGIVHQEYKWTPETAPDPVVGEEYWIFPVVQYFNGEGKVIWPASWKEQEMQIPAYLQ
jgi:branched-chain amino acid transport system substrate-binding protein